MMPEPIRTVRWADEAVEIVDQNALPQELRYRRIVNVRALVEAVKSLTIRGAPALGAAGAYGVVLAVRESVTNEGFLDNVRQVREARPTAVNLSWGVDRVAVVVEHLMVAGDRQAAYGAALEEAAKVCDEDIAANRAIARAGLELVPDPAVVITHCNTGDLATVSGGTALGVLMEAARRGRTLTVYADETRPRMQGAKLTAWELARCGIETYIVPDGAAAALMSRRKVDLVIVGADRIAANGDTANKIGTYSLAIAAERHEVPFYVAAPVTTVDLVCSSGDDIEVEMRSAEEVLDASGAGCIKGIRAYNPAFDVTPADLITAIVSDKGILRPDYVDSLKRACRDGGPTGEDL